MSVLEFIRESNMIEGIIREPTGDEVQEYKRFITLAHVKVADLEEFVSIYESGAELRRNAGMNVRVGSDTPLAGGHLVEVRLRELLNDIQDNDSWLSPYDAHIRYEKMHPFMDGNGRSGRMLWAWHMTWVGRKWNGTFLQEFYYQSLRKE